MWQQKKWINIETFLCAGCTMRNCSRVSGNVSGNGYPDHKCYCYQRGNNRKGMWLNNSQRGWGAMWGGWFVVANLRASVINNIEQHDEQCTRHCNLTPNSFFFLHRRTSWSRPPPVDWIDPNGGQRSVGTVTVPGSWNEIQFMSRIAKSFEVGWDTFIRRW